MKKYILILIALLALPFAVRADFGDGCSYMMDWYGWGSWGMLIFPLFWILMIVGIVVFVTKGISRNGEQTGEKKSNKAVEILEERYARGEISKEKFDEMKKDVSR